MQIQSSADYVRMTRAALAAAGFVRSETGGTVYWTAGEGTPLVLLHGANDQAGTWFTVAPALAAGARVILPDLAGHGESEPGSGPLPLDLLLERVESVVDAELGESATLTLAGNSLGGWIAMLYAFAHPARVTHLVLETAGGLDRPFASEIVAHAPDEAVAVLRAAHGPRFEPQPWMIEALIRRSSDSPLLRIMETERRYVDGRLREIRCPTTLIWGADDGILPVAYAEELREGIAGATLHVISGAAHIPHLQRPVEFLDCLRPAVLEAHA